MRRGDVGAAGDAVHGVAVPLAPQQLAERRAHAVGDDQPPAGDLEPLAPGRPRARTRRPRPGRRRIRTSTARAPSTACAPALIAVVRRWSSSSVRATADPHAGSDPPGHGSSSVCPNPCARSPWLTVCARSQSSRPSRWSSPIARGREPVAAGLVAREHRRVRRAARPARPAPPRPRPPTGGAGPDDEDVRGGGSGGSHPRILSDPRARTLQGTPTRPTGHSGGGPRRPSGHLPCTPARPTARPVRGGPRCTQGPRTFPGSTRSARGAAPLSMPVRAPARHLAARPRRRRSAGGPARRRWALAARGASDTGAERAGTYLGCASRPGGSRSDDRERVTSASTRARKCRDAPHPARATGRFDRAITLARSVLVGTEVEVVQRDGLALPVLPNS